MASGRYKHQTIPFIYCLSWLDDRGTQGLVLVNNRHNIWMRLNCAIDLVLTMIKYKVFITKYL